MGKAGKWLKNFLSGKKSDKENTQFPNQISSDNNSTTPISTPREKKRWSFRRPSPSKESNISAAATPPATATTTFDMEKEQEKHEMAVATAVAASTAATAAIRLTAQSNKKSTAIEEAAAIKIQSVFRSYLVHTHISKLTPKLKHPQNSKPFNF